MLDVGRAGSQLAVPIPNMTPFPRWALLSAAEQPPSSRPDTGDSAQQNLSWLQQDPRADVPILITKK